MAHTVMIREATDANCKQAAEQVFALFPIELHR